MCRHVADARQRTDDARANGQAACMPLPPDLRMNPNQPDVPSDHPDAPMPRSASSYVVDAVAMALYLVAITACAMFLDVPYPPVIALVIAFVCVTGLSRSAPGRRTTMPPAPIR